jgi:membrane-anchored mycosin MYCP
MLVRLPTVLALATTATLVGAQVLLLAGPASAAEAACTDVTTRDTTSSAITGPSVPYDLVGMAAAVDHVDRFAPARPRPVRVAVVDTGVLSSGDGAIVVPEVKRFASGDDGIEDPGGTEVAGLVAGHQRSDELPVGFAPTAEIVDVQVALVRAGDPDQVPPDAARVAQGLDWVASNAEKLNIKVATVAYPVSGSSALRDAVQAVQRAGVVVVAATGDQPQDGSSTTDEGEGDGGDASDEPTKPPDAADTVRPAGYAGVVAVSSTADGIPGGGSAASYVLANSRTTVAVPTYGAVSYAINGKTCLVAAPSTSAATGEVAGIVALLWQRFPDETRAQIVARLVNTASGTTDDPTPYTGAGVVQPLEALTRPLAPAKDGTVEQNRPVPTSTGTVRAPEPTTDLLASARDHAVWWGLIGGGLVVVALILRPVLSRPRRR